MNHINANWIKHDSFWFMYCLNCKKVLIILVAHCRLFTSHISSKKKEKAAQSKIQTRAEKCFGGTVALRLAFESITDEKFAKLSQLI